MGTHWPNRDSLLRAQAADLLHVVCQGHSLTQPRPFFICTGCELGACISFCVPHGLPLTQPWPINSADLVHVSYLGLPRHLLTQSLLAYARRLGDLLHVPHLCSLGHRFMQPWIIWYLDRLRTCCMYLILRFPVAPMNSTFTR